MDKVSAHIIDRIPFSPPVDGLIKRLRIRPGKEAEFLRLLEAASRIARPRGLYLAAYLTNRGEDWIEIEGVRFTSRVLRVNLEPAHRVFPYLATCGVELQQWGDELEDMLLRYWAEIIKEAALACALREVSASVEGRYCPGKTSTMSPGSLQDWPIEEQRPLFRLLGAHSDQIGVRLTDSLLMAPSKTVSGIRFPNEVDFESCQLCSRDGCLGRRAIYDPQLYDERFCADHG